MKNTIGQSKFWVYSTTFVMSFNGGYINSISLVSILKNSVGYVTGNLTQAGQSIDHGDMRLLINLIALVICFLIGAIISGLVVQGQNFKIDRRYSTTLALQLILVTAAAFLLFYKFHQAGYLLALAMGMQNAMTTHYSSALIRTTHMTGTTTDLGILIAQWIKGCNIQFWKVILYLSLIIGFTVGAILGALAYSYFHVLALFVCILFYAYMLIFPYLFLR